MTSSTAPHGFGPDHAFDGRPTLTRHAPPGFRLTTASRVIGHGDDDFRRAADAVLRFEVHRGSVFLPEQVPERARVGEVNVWAIPVGPLRSRVACRVFAVVDDERTAGFGHAALVGHPQRGWESYLVHQHHDGRVTLDIRVVWRPAAWFMRAAGPAARLALGTVLHRNLRALDPVLAA